MSFRVSRALRHFLTCFYFSTAKKKLYMPYLVGIPDCTHVGSATPENTTNQAADVLVEDLLQLLLDW